MDTHRDLPRLLASHRYHLYSANPLIDALRNGVEPPLPDEIPHDLCWQADRDVEWLESDERHHLITLSDPDYPASLRAIHDPPALLFGVGHRDLLAADHTVGVVGARAASAYGRHQAERIAAEVAGAGVVIISGLALGVDAAAHRGALDAAGDTIAVLGCGPDLTYPRRHWKLAAEIRDKGLVLSEYPPGLEAAPFHFPRRNRILVGLCRGVLVIEAAIKSGSLISARLAAAEGRDVMALPGLVTSRLARGVHQLIRDGAVLVESGADVLRELGVPVPELEQYPGAPGLTPVQQMLLNQLSLGPHTVDMLVETGTVPVEELMVNLVTLEVLGLLVTEAGRYQLKS